MGENIALLIFQRYISVLLLILHHLVKVTAYFIQVRIHELTKQFGVSVETIRRDLLELERQDCLHRVHGGAVGIAVAKQYHRLEERTEENPQKKEELSGYAAGLIREGMC